MRMQMLKIVVVLLIAGSGDARPQKSGADSAVRVEVFEASNAGWRGIRTSDKSHDIVRDDSRYTGTSGSNRKSYITDFRARVDSSRERDAVGSRVSGFTPNGTARSFSARRSKLDNIWLVPESKATDAPSDFSRPDTLGEARRIGAVRNSDEVIRSTLQGLSSDSKTMHDEKVAWIRSALAFNRSSVLGVNRASYSGKTNSENLERSKIPGGIRSDLQNSKSPENNSPPSHAFGFQKANDDMSIVTKNRQASVSVRYNLSPNRDTFGSNDRKQSSNISPSQTARWNVPNHLRKENAAAHSIHKDRNAAPKSAEKINSTVVSYENLKPGFVIDSVSNVGAVRRDGLNNSGKSTHEVGTPKADVVDQSMPPRKASSNRNFVRLRHPFAAVDRRNASSVALNSPLNDVRFTAVQLRNSTNSHFTQQAAANRPDLNGHSTFESASDRYPAQKLPSQVERVDGGSNEAGDEYSGAPDANLKNWPNEAFQSIDSPYDRYTSSPEKESNHDSNLQDAAPILLSSDDDYISHSDPILDSSVKKIIHWLKIPEIEPNGTHYVGGNVHKPVESVLESVYADLSEPNRPVSVVGTHDGDYETVVLQDATQHQGFDRLDYHEIDIPNSSSVVFPQYAIDSSNPSILVPLLQNKTVYSPTTHVTQNTVVHILNDGLKKPDVTVAQLKVPQSDASVDHEVSSGSSAESVQRPDVSITIASQKDEGEQPAKQETDTSPPAKYNANCPTIMINTYTRVNNTIESKEGCTDLNIIVNSHVSASVFEPSHGPIEEASYDDADGSNKYVGGIVDDLSHQDSSISYVTAASGSSHDPLATPDQNYYDAQKDPAGTFGDSVAPQSPAVEVFQGTQISVLGSNVPLTEVTASPVLAGAGGPVGTSVDGPALGDPAAAGASVIGPPVGGGLSVGQNSPGTVMGQANNALGTLQVPALPNLKPGALPGAGGGLSSKPSSDDDDDDDYDMSPGGILNSIASVFTYFSFMNPLGYSFFSLAAAPFAAMAAGVLGVAAVVFPWALDPSVLEYGRASNTIRFRPNLEEFVRQAVHKYDRLNEWKSRRRKNRR